MTPIVRRLVRWYCPNCLLEDARYMPPAPLGGGTLLFHTCPAMKGLTAPLYQVGVKVKVTRRDREDYVGKELVQKDADGRPVMSIVSEREDGTDCIVFAPTATLDPRA